MENFSNNNQDSGEEVDPLLAGAIPIDPDELPRIQDIDEITREPVGHTDPLTLVATDSDDDSHGVITTFGSSIKDSVEEHWRHAPSATGGASHMKTFVTKMRLDAIDYLDEQVNEWLDEHPDYRVKFASTSVGEMKGKTTENALIMTVWV